MGPVFEAEMKKGDKGVIYFSLGTIANTSTIDKKVMESFLEIVKKFPDYHFLIRADKNDKNTKDKATEISNVFVSDWLPQPAILREFSVTFTPVQAAKVLSDCIFIQNFLV